MKISQVLEILNEWAPEADAQEWDNVGLLVGSEEDELTGILVALDVTAAIANEAKESGSNLIITHHPIIFNPLYSLRRDEYPASVIVQLIKNDLSLYTMHTNLDIADSGVNESLAEKLKLKDIKPFDDSELGALGRIGELQSELRMDDFLKELKLVLDVEALTYKGDTGQLIKKVALCSGAGGSFIETAVKLKADVFVSSDFKHSNWLEAGDRIALVNAGHFESEEVVLDSIIDKLGRKMDAADISIKRAKSESKPYKLYNSV
ncbi:MAG: Nif3-like dinuclear metal center hexameric protein [Candidatus Marinimicrobia bacterium]|nr:Nif3-like dinuclear metal center hexameric protein [Candidatus Neomarinimicrobiota bacterium]